MALSTLKKQFFTTVAGVALAIGVASSAQASAGFTVDPGAIGVDGGTSGLVSDSFVATSMTGNSTELLTSIYDAQNNITGHAGVGFIKYGYFGDDSFNQYSTSYPVKPTAPDKVKAAQLLSLGAGYDIYVKFQFTEVASAVAGQSTLTSLTYSMYADMGADDVFTPAVISNGSVSGPTVTVVGTDKLLGSGTLISGISVFNSNKGATLDASTTFALTDDGKLFFPSPNPFLSETFNAFVNPSGGVVSTANGKFISINSSSGNTTFNFPEAAVPEPTSVALLGLGLLGLGLTGRRRKS